LGSWSKSLWVKRRPAALVKNAQGTIFVKAGEFGARRPIVREWTIEPLKLAKFNDVLVCVVGATCGKLNLGLDCAIGRSVAALQPNEALHQMYLYYYLTTKVLSLRGDSTGSAQGVISKADLGQIEIPAAPLAEQKRIIANIEELISELDNGIESLKTAREQLQVYRQAVLKHAFEGKLTAAWREDRVNGDELNWSNAVLGDLLELVTSGSRGWAKYYSSKGDVFIRAQNLKYDRLDLDDVAFVQIPEKSEGTRTRVQVGDVLITITGANVTKAEDIGTAYVSQHVALARPTEALLSEFLHWFLVSEAAGRKQLNASAYGAGKPGLNLDNIKSVVVPLPTKQEQMEIINRLNSILSVVQNCEAGIDVELKRSDALRQSILKKV